MSKSQDLTAGPVALLRKHFGDSLQTDLPLATVTTMAIGGPARWFLPVRTEAELVQAIRVARSCNINWFVIGAGSNVIACDGGFDGLIIQSRIQAFHVAGTELTVGAGETLHEVVMRADQLGLAGLEKMASIPGTIGGAIYGCAGAFGQQMSDHVRQVRYYDARADRFGTVCGQECQFGYRDSVFKRHKEWIITQAVLDLPTGQPEALLATSQEISEQRRRRFAGTLKCPGCYFKNIRLDLIESESHRQAFVSRIDPAQITYGKVAAGYLLEAIGAKGLRIGGVQVSPHHGNVIVNVDGAACAADLLSLVEQLKKRVREQFGVELQEEVQYLAS